MRFLVLGCLIASAAAGLGQIQNGLFDNFSDGQLHGWGSPNAAIIGSNGAGGPSDPYLTVTSDGAGQAGKLAVHNTSTWVGNWQAAGVNRVELQIRNPNSVQLEIRIVLFDGLTTARWTSTNAVIIPPNSGWTAATFGVLQSDLTQVRGTSSYTSVIQNVNRFMVRHDVGTPTDGGTNIIGEMGLDNIRAVPEPGSLAALGIGAFAILRRRR